MTRGRRGPLLPSPYDSFIHYTSPVLTGARRRDEADTPGRGEGLGNRTEKAPSNAHERPETEVTRCSDRGDRESGSEMNWRWSGGWCSLALLACQVAGCSLPPGGEPNLGSALRARQLMVPVAGVSPGQVPDNFRAPRGGARIHGAVDIPAPRGTPVLSADDGRVLRLQRNRKGGLTIYATDESEHFIYYYAHLDAYSHGLAKDTRLVRGQVIGFVGTTGDAHRREPHLHFQLMVRPSDGRSWDGHAIDPRPYFTSAGRPNGERTTTNRPRTHPSGRSEA